MVAATAKPIPMPRLLSVSLWPSNALPTSRRWNSGAVTPTIVTVGAVDDERCTDDAVSPCEAPLPESVADDRDRAARPRLRVDRPLA
jgi:hypothetical protein